MGDHQQQQGMSARVGDGGLELPPGFRFHPSDEEVISFYLTPKVLDNTFTTNTMGEADLNKSEPWELPGLANMGENEWYFYYLQDRKYSTGPRMNRATKVGYWKSTGKDREIYRVIDGVPVLVGMKKTLVFYMGRAPTGERTDWVMHEFRLDSKGSLPCPTSTSSSKEWVVCRVFQKSPEVKRAHRTKANNNVEQRSLSFPLPMQFPIGPEDFTIDSNTLGPLMDPVVPFYPTTGASSSIAPTLSPLEGVDSCGLRMNAKLLRNPMAMAQPMSVYDQQMESGVVGEGGFMDKPDSILTPIIPQDIEINPEQINNVVSYSFDMDDIWKY